MRKPVDLTKFSKEVKKSLKISDGFKDPDTWVSTGNYLLNYFISGNFYNGVPLGKLTMLAGASGCLPKDATVTVRYHDIEEQVSVEKLKELYMSGDYEIEIDTPDGWNKITNWFDKGELDMVLIKMDSGKSTRCAYNHLVQLANEEWVLASEVKVGQVLLTVDGEEIVESVEHLDKKEECFDFTVDHPNHRYYGDGISSHNSGKSYIASGNIARECQQQGITPILIDTENALDEEWLGRLGVDTENLLRFPVAMINDVGKIISLFIEDYTNNYMTLEPEERPKFMFIIDSLGMLLTDTDVAQFQKGDMKGDMGRKPKQLNALVRNIINKIGDLNIGVVCTNHTYASQDMFDPDDKVSGGCLINGTEVITEAGLKMIEEMEVGDRVLSNDGEFHDVLKTWEFEKPTYKLELEDGQVFECSPEHKFAVGTPDNWEWVEAQHLKDTDYILSFEDSELPDL